MFDIIISLVMLLLIGYGAGKNTITEFESSRHAKFFPFYTIGRFANTQCSGSNTLLGTCVINGECSDNNGISTGSCSTLTSQAVCCVYQRSCGTTTTYNNTYFYNTNYPNFDAGGTRCAIGVNKCNTDICQLRIDFLDFSLAQPNGDGNCVTDYISITGGSSRVPRICGENTGQHVYVDFNNNAAITIAVETTSAFTFNRQWHLKISQIACESTYRAPSGCLQYYLDNTGSVASFNYLSAPNPLPNAIGVQGSRQLANSRYGICVRMAANMCSITWSQASSDIYSFTVTGDVGAVDTTLLGTSVVQSQTCTTDYIIIPFPSQNGAPLTTGTDRFCGLGLVDTTSSERPFVIYVNNDANENADIANRGISLSYVQNECPVV